MTNYKAGKPSELDAKPQKVEGQWTQVNAQESELSDRLLILTQELLPKFGKSWNQQSALSLTRQTYSRILYYHDLYTKVLDVPGVICEFGVQWGTTLAQMIAMRGMYEPFNHSRKVIGFDTFEGFTSVDDKDGEFSAIGDYSVTEGYETLLEEILSIHELNSPISHIKKFELVRGDASQTFPIWLEENPHAIVSMAIFDMDVYLPTKNVLEALLPRLTKGSLLVFDELNSEVFPGETRALDEILGLNNIRLHRNPHQPICSWAIFGE